jgi:hypothetical protein
MADYSPYQYQAGQAPPYNYNEGQMIEKPTAITVFGAILFMICDL